MQVIITNLSSVAVPFSSSDDKGFAVLLEPNQSHTLDSEAVTVANIGDNPSFGEELADSFKGLVDVLVRFITFWKDNATRTGASDKAQIHVNLSNHGSNGLRVLLGSNTNEVTVQPGASQDLNSEEYIEIRELGV
jgi:hypothetical protein